MSSLGKILYPKTFELGYTHPETGGWLSVGRGGGGGGDAEEAERKV